MTEIVKRALSRSQDTQRVDHRISSPLIAVQEAHAVYTDVWASMGFENKTDETLFAGFQVNEKLMETRSSWKRFSCIACP